MLLVFKLSNLFRAACYLFSSSNFSRLVSFERFAPIVLKFCSSERFTPSCQRPSLFRAVCSLFSKSSVSFERFSPCSQFLYSLSSGLLHSLVSFPRSISLVPFERFAPCVQILWSLSSSLLLVLKFSSLIRAALLAPCFQIL